MAAQIHAHGRDIPKLKIHSIEGLPVQGIWIKPLLVGDEGLLIECHARRGATIPEHVHKHESICYLIKGKVRARIGDEVKELGPGDAFLHLKGARHSNEILEDATWIELKVPPEQTWDS